MLAARLIGALSAVGLALSGLVHALTFVGIDLLSMLPKLISVHVGALVASGLASYHAHSRGYLDMTVRKLDWDWRFALVLVAFLYMPLNFGLFLWRSEGATADVRQGKHVLHLKETILRELSVAEYRQQKMYETRGITGHWMFFYLLPAVYFLSVQRDWSSK